MRVCEDGGGVCFFFFFYPNQLRPSSNTVHQRDATVSVTFSHSERNLQPTGDIIKAGVGGWVSLPQRHAAATLPTNARIVAFVVRRKQKPSYFTMTFFWMLKADSVGRSLGRGVSRSYSAAGNGDAHDDIVCLLLEIVNHDVVNVCECGLLFAYCGSLVNWQLVEGIICL